MERIFEFVERQPRGSIMCINNRVKIDSDEEKVG